MMFNKKKEAAAPKKLEESKLQMLPEPSQEVPRPQKAPVAPKAQQEPQYEDYTEEDYQQDVAGAVEDDPAYQQREAEIKAIRQKLAQMEGAQAAPQPLPARKLPARPIKPVEQFEPEVPELPEVEYNPFQEIIGMIKELDQRLERVEAAQFRSLN